MSLKSSTYRNRIKILWGRRIWKMAQTRGHRHISSRTDVRENTRSIRNSLRDEVGRISKTKRSCCTVWVNVQLANTEQWSEALQNDSPWSFWNLASAETSKQSECVISVVNLFLFSKPTHIMPRRFTPTGSTHLSGYREQFLLGICGLKSE